MAENAYLDLLGDILVALAQERHGRRAPEPKRRRQWRQICNVVDGKGQRLGQVKLSKDKMIALKSPKTGRRLYKVKGSGWLLETKRHSARGLGELVPLTQEQAHQWMKGNGWTYLEQKAGQAALQYTPRPGERVYVAAGDVRLDTREAPNVRVVSEGSTLDVLGHKVRAVLAAGAVMNHLKSRDVKQYEAELAAVDSAADAASTADPAVKTDPVAASLNAEETLVDPVGEEPAGQEPAVQDAEANDEADLTEKSTVGEVAQEQPIPDDWANTEIDWTSTASDGGWTVIDPEVAGSSIDDGQVEEFWDDLNASPITETVVEETTTTYS